MKMTLNKSRKGMGITRLPVCKKDLNKLHAMRSKLLAIAHQIGGEDGKELSAFARNIKLKNCIHSMDSASCQAYNALRPDSAPMVTNNFKVYIVANWDMVWRLKLADLLSQLGWTVFDRNYVLGCMYDI